MSGIFVEQTDRLVCFYFRSHYWRGLPETGPEEQGRAAARFLHAATPGFLLLYRACIVSIHALALIREGRTFNRLDDSRKEALMDWLLLSSNPLLRGIPIILSAPLFMPYMPAAGMPGMERAA